MLEVTQIHQGDALYPSRLARCLGDGAPKSVNAIGNVRLIEEQPLALFCSRKCPGSVILKTYDFAQRLRELGTCVIGGFHSPLERECLTILLRGSNPIIICLARG